METTLSCPGGGGDGGDNNGPGGGNPGGVDNHYYDDEMCQSCRDFEPQEHAKLMQAAEAVCPSLRDDVLAALTAFDADGRPEFGMRVTAYHSRGTHYKDYHLTPRPVDYHYSISSTHPGFTGVNRDGQISPAQQLIELAGTLAHEIMHHQYYPADRDMHPEINRRTKECVPGYIGY